MGSIRILSGAGFYGSFDQRLSKKLTLAPVRTLLYN